ncbi:MAG: sugar transferase [Acidobacteria bacterium]|nr:sugar transferase [Acidobacteriota bacterium]
MEYDLYYVKHRSLLFDLSILARTVGTVAGLKGR